MTVSCTHFTLPERYAGQTERLRLGGESPLHLDTADKAWIIEQGRVELFLVAKSAAGEAAGVRHHLATLSAGTLMLGIDPEFSADMLLLAVAHMDTELVGLPLAAIVETARESAHRAGIAALLDPWLMALHSGMASWILPRPYIDTSLASGEHHQVAQGVRYSAEHGVIWLQLEADDSLYLDTQDVEFDAASGCFPLAADAWLLSLGALELEARATETALADDGCWSGITTLHRLLFETAGISLRLANADELNRLKARRAANTALRDQAFADLMRVTGTQPAAAVAVSSAREDPLVTGLRLIGREEGFEIRLPAKLQPGSRPSIEAIARASGLRLRAITLANDWWRRDFGSLLTFDADTGEPLVLLFGTRSQPKLIDPSSGKEQDFRPERIAPAAWEFTAHLPFRAIRIRDLFGVARQRGWRDLTPMMLLSAIGALIGLTTPIATGYIIDDVLPDDNRRLLIELGIVLVVLAATSFVVSYVSALSFNRAESKISRALQSGIMDRVLRLPMGFFKEYSTGDLANRVMAVSTIQSMLSTGTVKAVLGGVFSVFSFVLMFRYDPELALWATLVTSVYILASLVISVLLLREQRQLAQLNGRLGNLLLQMILGVAKIRLAAGEDRAFSRWANLFSQNRHHQLAAQRLSAWQSALSQAFTLAGLLTFVLVIGKPSDTADMLAIGAFSALLVTYQRFASSLESMLQVASQVLSMQPLIERSRPLLETAPEISADQPEPGELSGNIEIAQVSFRYDKSTPFILNDLSLEIPAGHFIAIVGGSGAGKSTLMRLLLGFETPESGAVFFDGQDMASVDVTAVRRQMGVVMQNSQLLPGSLYDNIMGPSGGSLEAAWQAAERVGLAEDIRQMPMGMHTMVLEGGGALSGGQMQRLMIARAIVGQPKILLLDEATSALDNRTQAVVTESLDRLHITRIVIAHRLSTVVNADRIYVMDRGHVVEAGRHDELMARNGLFADLARRQQ